MKDLSQNLSPATVQTIQYTQRVRNCLCEHKVCVFLHTNEAVNK